MTGLTAELHRPVGVDQRWRWEVPRAADRSLIGLERAPLRCLERLEWVDRFTRSSVNRFAVRGRYEAAEVLLDGLWRSVVQPLLGELAGEDAVRFRVPAAFARLPLATARSAATGESLIHCLEPALEWTMAAQLIAPPYPAHRPVVRLDGHYREIASHLTKLSVEAGATLLVLGCRTAELLPLIARTGAGAAVVTSWDVEDRHCGPFGDELEALLAAGLSPAASLRSVQARWSWRHPYEWGGYALVRFVAGEYRERIDG